MKLSLYLLLITTFGLHAESYSQKSKVTMSVFEESLLNIINELRITSDYQFLYQVDELSRYNKKSLEVKEADVEEVMQKLLEDTHLTWRIEDDVILIKADAKSEKQAQQQTKVLKGIVTDTKNNPLPGVTVQIKNQVYGVVTNSDGKYEINLPDIKDLVIVFTFVGMEKQEIIWKGEEKINVILKEDITEMDEVIITGYQTLSRRETASSVVQIRAEDILMTSKSSIDQMLAGQIPGMSVIQTSGEPSAVPKIRIRGTSTILGKKSPLWVLDGIILEDPVQIDNSQLNGEDAEYLIGNAIAGLNPNDIETITVLKDASATAIYGIRAANGVIVVTTKKGKEGKTVINYNGGYVFNQRPYYGDFYLMNAQERIQLSQDIIENYHPYSRIPTRLGYEGLFMDYLDRKLNYEEFHNEVNKMAKRNTDWYDILFRNSFSHKHSISMSGGNRNYQFYTSISYNNDQGTAKKSESERYSVLLKINSKVRNNLEVGINVNAFDKKDDGFHASFNPNSYAYQTSRTIPLYNDDGTLFYYETIKGAAGVIALSRTFNALNEMNETSRLSRSQNFTGQFKLKWNILNSLTYDFEGSYQMSNSTIKQTATANSYFVGLIRGYDVGGVEPNSKEEEESELPYGGVYSLTNNRATTYTMRNSFNYSELINNLHQINALVGYEIRSAKHDGSSATYYGWEPDRGNTVGPTYTSNYIDNLISKSAPLTIKDNVTNNLSWYATAAYTFDNKYTINANIRSDGSNKFGTNPKYRFLPVWSISGKYTISEEAILKYSFVNHLAIRASYGIQGQIDESSSPDLIVKVQPRDNLTSQAMSTIEFLPNEDLRWEKTKSFDFALEFNLWKSSVSGVFEYYFKKGEDMIINKEISQSFGKTMMKINAGNLENKGYEFTLNFKLLNNKDYNIALTLNGGTNKQKITKANLEDPTISDLIYGNNFITGKPVGSFYSYKFAGLDSENGYPKFYDIDGEKRYRIVKDKVDLVYSGNEQPKMSGGFTTNMRYKQLSLTMGFNYSLGGKARLPSIYQNEYGKVYDPLVNLTKEVKNRWKKPGDENYTYIPSLFDYEFYKLIRDDFGNEDSRSFTDGQEMYDFSDLRVSKTSNLRCRNLVISYSLSRRILEKLKIESCRLHLETTNLFLIAKKDWRGYDPESGGSNTPLPRTYTLGLNVSF